MTTLRQLGEREVIRRLAALLRPRRDVPVGIGDDVAVVRLNGAANDLLLTSDAVIEGAHFLAGARAEEIGHKAIARVLSDFAAMGGEPLWALIDLVASPEMPVTVLESVYRGAAATAKKYGLAIVGGDTASGAALELHVFGVGQVPKGKAVLRSGAKRGDAIYVTGALGGSLAGKHLVFEPRLEEGLWLRKGRWVTSMIDISDGLATDLGHLLRRSGVGAEIEASAIPISDAVGEVLTRRTPLEHALYDGEDFELLFTVPAARCRAFESAWTKTFELSWSRIGLIKKGRAGSAVLRSADGSRDGLQDKGYEHFSG